MRYGMVIDLKRCIGCYGCQIFCKVENRIPSDMVWLRLLFYESGTYPAVKKITLPIPCMHCGRPACVAVCPTGASVKRSDGIVVIHSTKCVGCGNCLSACPYGARQSYLREGESFPGQGITVYEKFTKGSHSVGTVGKCNFCVSRLEKGLMPACVQNCMSKARTFGDLDDPQSEVAELIRERGGRPIGPLTFPGGPSAEEPDTDPSVYFLEP